MTQPTMFYFGPWDEPGHYLFNERGESAYRHEKSVPWTLGQMDGGNFLPHTCGRLERGMRCGAGTCAPYGKALIHHKEGWTAIAFWDSSVDKRSGCVSVYVAQGEFAFDDMVGMAKTRFAKRWNKMQFAVELAERKAGS